MRTLLVSGGCGFIGSHLVRALVAAGDRVRVLDDLSTGRLDHLPPDVDFRRGSVDDPLAVAAAMDGVEGCFHLAAVPSVERARLEWLSTHRINLSGTICVMAEAAMRGIPVAYASSAAVYGQPRELPLTEAAPTRPISAYGIDKLACELHAAAAGPGHGLRSVGLRFFNVYGSRQDPASPYSGVITLFCDALIRGRRLTIHGEGTQTRDFVPVSYVVQALRRGLDIASVEAPVFNVCSGISTSMIDLVTALGSVLGVKVATERAPSRIGDISHSVGSTAKLRAALGLGLPSPLADGLRPIVAWMEEGSQSLGQ
jgi:UDP-glucose 4-epimerase